MSANPASPAKSAMPLAVNSTPLSADVAAPPTPVPGAPDGTVAGGRVGELEPRDVVGGDVGGDPVSVVDDIGGCVVVGVVVVVVGAVVDVAPEDGNVT
jgi:hypothetical protein